MADRLLTNEALTPGQSLDSSNGLFTFVLQGDGNLVLYYRGRPYWASGTNGHSAEQLIMQGDGNLVIYFTDRNPWSTMTNGNGPSFFVMQNDGNAVIYKNDDGPTWDTATDGIAWRPREATVAQQNGSTRATVSSKVSNRPDGTGFVEMTVKVRKSGINGTGYATGRTVLTDRNGNTLWKSDLVRKQKGANFPSGVASGSAFEDFVIPQEIMNNVENFAIMASASDTIGLPIDISDATDLLNELADFLKAGGEVIRSIRDIVILSKAI